MIGTDLTVYLDLTADSGAVATMSEEAADALGWSLNGATIENDDGYCYVIFGSPWDDSETDAANDAQADHDRDEAIREIEAAGLDWEEV